MGLGRHWDGWSGQAHDTNPDYANIKFWSQYELVWNFDFNDGNLWDENQIYLDYLRSGGILYQTGENMNTSADAMEAIENFVAHIDDDITDANKTSITTGGSGGFSTTDGSTYNTTTELHAVGADYNVSNSWNGSGNLSDAGSSYNVTRGDGVALAGAFHAEHLGSGDLITTQTHDDGTVQGFIAEWGGDDSNTEYFGTFIGWLDVNVDYNDGSDVRLAHDVVQWGMNQAEAVTGGIVTDNEAIPYFKSTHDYAYSGSVHDSNMIEAFHMGNNVYIGGGYNHLDWVYDSESYITVASTETGYSVSSQETGPRELAFSSDGTKFFVTGYQGSDVGEYSMSTAWDVSTASYTDAFSVSSQTGTGAHGLAFNTDGTKMFVGSYNSNSIHEYGLSTGFDVSTASYTDAFSVSSQDTEPRGLAFSTDGTKMFITGNTGDTIEEYTLSTGFDVSSASHTDSMDVSSYDNNPRGITFNDDGTTMFYHGQQNDKIHSWKLSTGYDLSTGTYNNWIKPPSFDTGAEAIVFSNDGSKLFVSGNDDNTIDEYTLFAGWDDANTSYVAINTDLDAGSMSAADDHFTLIGVDKDNDNDLWETTDTFDLDKIFIKGDSEDFLTKDSDASGDYYFKITPVTWDGLNQNGYDIWTYENENTVTVSNTTGYNDYLDLTSNTDFDNINWAVIESESALISEVIVSY